MKIRKHFFTKFSALAIGVLLSCSANAQYSYGTMSGGMPGGNTTKGEDVEKDPSGNIYVSGTFLNNAAFPGTCFVPASAAPGNVAYLAKLDPNGVLLWVNYDRGLGSSSEGKACTVDTINDKVFVVGEATGEVKFLSNGHAPCASPPAATPWPVTATHYYVSCFNRNTGAHIKSHDVNVALLPAGFNSFNITSVAHRRFQIYIGSWHTVYHLYLTGSAKDASGVTRAIVTCVVYNATINNYNTLWSTPALGGAFTSSQGNDIIHYDFAGNVVITGEFVSSVNFNSSFPAATTIGNNDAFICAFDRISGVALGSPIPAGPTLFQNAAGTALTWEPTGKIYLTGWYTGNLNNLYGSGLTLLGTTSKKKTFVTAMTPAGTFPWANRIDNISPGENQSTGITWNVGNVYVYGKFINGNILMGSGAGYPYVSSGGLSEYRTYLCSFNRASGAMVDGNVTVSSLISDHQPTRAVYHNAKIYSTGYYKKELDYFSGTAGILNAPSPTIYEMFVMRNSSILPYDYQPRPAEPTGIVETELINKQISIFPNPTNDKINLKIADLTGDAKLMIFDQKGSMVHEQILSGMDTEVDMSKLNAGLYLVKVKGQNIDCSQKIIKQ